MEKQTKTIEDHEDFNVDRDSIPLEEQKNVFNELVEEKASEFKNLQKRIDADNLIYKYKNEKKIFRDFFFFFFFCYLKLKTKQNMEKDSKYQRLSKYLKD